MNDLISRSALKEHMLTCSRTETPKRFHWGAWKDMCIDGEEVEAWIDSCPAVDAVPVAIIKAYLQSLLDDWNALGDRKWEPANAWGYNFIMGRFDDLDRWLDGERKDGADG